MTTNESHRSSWLHGYAVFVAICTFLLVIAGALVTSNAAGLSVPDWPTSFGSFRMPHMAGGVLFEHGHRMIAGTVGILTILLALAVWIKDSRRWVKWVAAGAVFAVLAQALLGGITVLYSLPVAISASHATLGQIFFCLATSLALFTRADWRWDEPKLEDASAPSLQRLSALMTAAVLLQLVLGAAYRHSGIGVAPHIAGAVVVTLLAVWVVVRIIMKFSRQPRLLRPALFLVALLMLQLPLGIGAYLMKMTARIATQPLPPVVNVTTAHVAMGALVLMASLYLTYQSHRYLATPVREAQITPAPHETNL
jgi:cytochrome c oxidase assembly protein subunit 15